MKKILILAFILFGAASIYAQNLPSGAVWGGSRVPLITANGDTSGYAALTDIRSFVGAGLGSGSVTSVSVAAANGFDGTVATQTTTPVITIKTTATGVLKGNGTAISAATAGTDYSAGTSALATGIVKSTTTTGALSIAVAGTDYVTPSGNITGTASNVTGTVAVANGGTGATALTGYIKGSGTSAFTASSTIPTSDLSGTITNAQLAGSIDLTTKVTGVLPLANGGTGSATQNFVDLSTTQATIGGAKTFTAALTSSGGFTSSGATALSGTTTLSGARVESITSVSTNTTLTASSGYTQDVDATSGNITITLPTSPPSGTAFAITKTSATNSVILSRGGANTINGNNTHTIMSKDKETIVKFRGGDWKVN